MAKYLIALLFAESLIGVSYSCFGGLGGGSNSDGSINDCKSFFIGKYQINFLLLVEITSDPSFEITYSPPVEWTYPANPVNPGTTASYTNTLDDSLDQATMKAQREVKMTLIEAMIENDLQIPSTISYDMSGVVGTQINAFNFKTNITDTYTGPNGLIESGVVSQICTAFGDKAVCTPYILTQTFRVRNGPLASGRQWKDVASSIQNSLMLQNVKITSPIIVTG